MAKLLIIVLVQLLLYINLYCHTSGVTEKNKIPGESLSIKNHPKAKSVNMTIKVPSRWKIREGNRPNVVKVFTGDSSIYLIMIKENATFFSRNEARELLKDDDLVNNIIQESILNASNFTVIDKSIVTIGTYPSIFYKAKVTTERTGLTITLIMNSWTIFYEDKLVLLQSSYLENNNASLIDDLFFKITNSVIFPDQYN